MKKIFLLTLSLAMIFSFISCEEDSSLTMNEDYAGTWYLLDGTDLYKSVQTDTTYEYSFWDGTAYLPLQKGSIKKIADGEMTSQMTAFYLTTENTEGTATIPEADEGWYNKEEMLQYGIDNGVWTDEADMRAKNGPDYDTVYTTLYKLSADGTTLTMTDKNDPLDVEVYVSVEPSK